MHSLYQTIKHLQYDYDLYLIAWSEYSRYTFYKRNNHDISFNIGLEHPIYGNDSSYRNFGKLLYADWYPNAVLLSALLELSVLYPTAVLLLPAVEAVID